MSNVQNSLDYLKAQCIEGESEEEHALHSTALEEAYANFANAEESNPAPQGETGLTADVAMMVDTGL